MRFLKDPSIQGSAVRHYLHLVFILFVFWTLLSGKPKTENLVMGLVICILAAYACFPLLMLENRQQTKKYFVFHVPIYRYILYGGWLLVEIVKSNLMVAEIVLKQDKKIDPKLAIFRFPMENPMAHVLLANSITLTPGTVTLEVTQNGVYTVHALNEEIAEDLLSGRFQKKVSMMFQADFSLYVPMGLLEEVDS